MGENKGSRPLNNDLIEELKHRHGLSRKERLTFVWLVGFLNGKFEDIDTEQRVAAAVNDYIHSIRS